MFVNVGITESINPKSLANLFNIRPERKQSMAESSMRIEAERQRYKWNLLNLQLTKP